MLKKKMNAVANSAKQVAKTSALTLTMAATMILTNGAMAAGGAQDLMTWVIKALGVLVLVPGLLFGVTGLISYASAHADGDGPAQNKATGKISAGLMLIVLSIVIIAASGTLAGYISTSV